MKSKLIWANFSVKDAKRTDEFYTQLGFTPNGSLNDPKLASFFFGENKFVIHFFEQGTGIDNYFPSGPKTDEIVFTLSTETEEEVQEFEAKVKKLEARFLKNYEGTNLATAVLHLLILMAINSTYCLWTICR